jgi:ABC-2 type transport system permease protein
MINILAIALNTFREAIRKKVFYLILIFIIVMLVVSTAVASVSLGEIARILIHFGLFSINIFGLLIAVFIGSQLIYEETERKTIYTAISHGVTRSQFILGKFLGLYMTIMVLTILMSVALPILFKVCGFDAVYSQMFLAIVLMSLQFLIICAVVILFSSFSTPILSAVLTTLFWLICNFTLDVENHARDLFRMTDMTFFPKLLQRIYDLFPNLAQYNQIREVIYPNEFVVIEFKLVALALLFTAVYLSLACMAFHHKDFE